MTNQDRLANSKISGLSLLLIISGLMATIEASSGLSFSARDSGQRAAMGISRNVTTYAYTEWSPL
jgi:hypothetical protein